jgi:membrane protease YdiL (CAAX protease family)
MTYDEKNAWAFLTIAVAGGVTYLAILLTASGGHLPYEDYGRILLLTIGAAILAGILAGIALTIGTPAAERRRDVRDREIARLGDHVGGAFVVIGAVAAMLLAVAEVDGFWIANVVYGCFVLSAVVGSIARLVAYRRGIDPR